MIGDIFEKGRKRSMNVRFVNAFEAILAENRNGEIRNLLITDNDEDFLNDALYALRSWALKNSMNLVELDERDDSWLPNIQSRELFYKLNQPNTVLMIKNYATVTYMRGDDNTPRNFLRDAVLNRHYGCGNDFEPSDELPNLRFVVVINDLTEMKWRSDEYMTFSIIHEDNSKMVWTNKNYTLLKSKMHPVMSAHNKVRFWVSEDETTLRIDLSEAFRGVRLKHPIRSRRPTLDERIEIIHTYIESNLPDFNERVVCLILKMERFGGNEELVVDGRRLRNSFPKLGSICCNDNFVIADVDDEACILDPFDLGEISFYLAQDGDIPMANTFVRDLWALDHKWARFFREVARDYYRKPEDHLVPEHDSAVHHWTGLDHLFRIYCFGWYHDGDDFFDEEDKVFVAKHKNIEKALDLLPVRFQNCTIDEVADKLYWDLRHLAESNRADYLQFEQVLEASEKICPGVLAKMRDSGWITEDFGSFFPIRTCHMCGSTFKFWDHEENISFDHFIGYGSSHDMHRVRINLCCACFDKVLDWVLPQCKNNPMTEYK